MAHRRNRSDRSRRFGTYLREGREKAGFTQESAAVSLGVSQPTVSAWECGDAFPTMSKVLAAARLFDLDLRELLERAEQDQDAEAALT